MTFEVEQDVMKRQPEYPATQSESGSNAYAMMCEHVGYRTGYCVCLNKIKAFKTDKSRLNPYPACEKAIRASVCPAIEMQKQEVAAGKSMFFLDRVMLREAMDKHYDEVSAANRADYFTARNPNTKMIKSGSTSGTSKPAPKVTNNLVQSIDEENGYAAAINAAMRELPKEPQPVAPAVIATPPVEKKGLSLLEMARLQLAQAKST